MALSRRRKHIATAVTISLFAGLSVLHRWTSAPQIDWDAVQTLPPIKISSTKDTVVWIPGAMEYEARDESRHGILSSRIVGFASESLRDESVHSVTLKPWKPATASMHDYVSLSKYYWPVEGKPELPWAHQSGAINPLAIQVSDYVLFRKTAVAVTSLATAVQFAPEHPLRDAFRSKAIERVNEWFCDSDTRMLPRMLYGSVVRNSVSKDLTKTEFAAVIDMGTKEGVLDIWPIGPLLRSVRVLDPDISTSKCLQTWTDSYIQFLETSRLPTRERVTNNNHGTYFDVSYLSLLAFSSNTSAMRNYFQEVTIPRLISQVQPNGELPHELRRKTSFYYSVFVMRGWTYLATIADEIGVDLWTLKREGWNYPIIRTAMNHLLEHSFSDPPGVHWPAEDITRDFTIPAYHRSQFYHAAKVYKIWDETDESSLKWRKWIEQLEALPLPAVS